MLFHFIYEDEKDSCQPSNNRAAELKSDCYESKQYIKYARLILSKRVWNVQTHRDYNPQKSSFQYRKWCTTTNFNAQSGCLFPHTNDSPPFLGKSNPYGYSNMSNTLSSAKYQASLSGIVQLLERGLSKCRIILVEKCVTLKKTSFFLHVKAKK